MHTNLTESRLSALLMTLSVRAMHEGMDDPRRQRLLNAAEEAYENGASSGWAYSAAIKADRARGVR